MDSYDIIVIGSGPAGQRAAIQAAKFGKKVALVEKMEVIGGAAINTGTIPSKTMREAVLHLSGFYYQNIYGVNYRVKEQITMADLSFRAQHVIKTEIDVTRAQLSRNGIEVLSGVASFAGPNRIQLPVCAGNRNWKRKKSFWRPVPNPRVRRWFLLTTATSSTAIRSCRCRKFPRR
jgi:NAD(P) transhydrogenase